MQSAPTPAIVSVHRDTEPLTIECTKNTTAGLTKEESKVSNWVWGNLLFGGIIGLGVDYGTSSMYNYPASSTVPMPTAAK